MKKSPLLFFFLLLFQFATAQNLVMNPGLDSYITCPGFGQFSATYINFWSKPNIASSDYYHYNCPSIQPTVQAPRSGEGYAGLIAFNFSTEYREYITGTLATPLLAGVAYNVEFYASLNNGYIQAINELGAYLSPTIPGPFSNALHINVIPQVENTTPLQDTMNWMKISGSFIAAGGEQYITIGNFNADLGTTITQPGTSGSFGAYYFIDDVSVTPDSTTSVQNLSIPPLMNIWQAEDNIHIYTAGIHASEYPMQLQIFNTTGQIVIQTEVNTPHEIIKFSCATGIYHFRILNSRTSHVASVTKYFN